MTDEETKAAFIAKAAETGLVAVSPDVFEALKRSCPQMREDTTGKIEMAVCEWMEPGTMVAIKDFAPIPHLGISRLIDDHGR